MVGDIVQGFLNFAKVFILITLSASFMIAISTLLNFVGTISAHSVIGEVFGIISCCLPFNALAVMSALGNVISGILAFIIARKIYNLYKEVFAAI